MGPRSHIKGFFVRRQSKAIDQFGGQDGCRKSFVIRVKSHSGSNVKAGNLRSKERWGQTDHAHNSANSACGTPSVAMSLNELGPHSVADRKQEHQEDGCLERRRNRDAELTDDNGRDKGCGHRAKAKAFVGERAEIIAQGQRQKDGYFGIAAEGAWEPVDHAVTRSCDHARRCCRSFGCLGPSHATKSAASHNAIAVSEHPRDGKRLLKFPALLAFLLRMLFPLEPPTMENRMAARPQTLIALGE